MAAELTPDRYLVSVGGLLDEGSVEALRKVLLPLAGGDGASIVLDLGDAALDGYDPMPTLVGAGAAAAAGGGSLTVVTGDPRLRAMLAVDGRIAVEATLEDRLL